MEVVTREDAVKNLKQYIGIDLATLAPQFGINPFLEGRQNKGWKGLVLERLAGLHTNVSKAPNGLTYELKSVAFQYTASNKLVPKETMAITMINAKELKAQPFFQSHLWDKFKVLVLCAVEWKGKNARNANLLRVVSLDFAKDDGLVKEIKDDYDSIRQKLVTQGFDALTGKDGKWIQPRTKGTGGVNPRTGKRRPITRAFYARKELVAKIFEMARYDEDRGK